MLTSFSSLTSRVLIFFGPSSLPRSFTNPPTSVRVMATVMVMVMVMVIVMVTVIVVVMVLIFFGPSSLPLSFTNPPEILCACVCKCACECACIYKFLQIPLSVCVKCDYEYLCM
jgi:hypothetical protein